MRTRIEQQLRKSVAEWVSEACAQFRVDPPRIVWSGRLTASAGRASRSKLTFSIPLLSTADMDVVKETAFHEAAHYIDFHLRGTSDHGEKWRAIMDRFGYPQAERCHRLDRTHLYRYVVRCAGCQKELKKYVNRPSRLLKTHRSVCCHARLYIVAA